MTRDCIRIVKADVKFFISTKIHHYLKNLTTAQINLTEHPVRSTQKGVLHIIILQNAFPVLQSSADQLKLMDVYLVIVIILLVIMFLDKNQGFIDVSEIDSKFIRQFT